MFSRGVVCAAARFVGAAPEEEMAEARASCDLGCRKTTGTHGQTALRVCGTCSADWQITGKHVEQKH
jgi:hypothetical protein